MNRGTVSESITVTDNRTGETREIAIEHGGVAASEFSRAVPGIWFYDPGFLYTAAAESSITFVDGDLGILRYRGYPIEQLAEHSTYLEVAYLLNNGELPTEAAGRGVGRRDHPPHVHPRERAQAIPRRLQLRRASDGHAGLGHRGPLDLLQGREDLDDPEILHRQIVRLIAKMPTLAAAAHRFSVGMPFVYPDNTLATPRTSCR
jgi:citrate synthase